MKSRRVVACDSALTRASSRVQSAGPARRATIAAAAGSNTSRISNSSARNPRDCLSEACQRSTSTSNMLHSVAGRTLVPTLAFDSTSPLATRIFLASRTTVRETPNISSRSGSNGKSVPCGYSPATIPSPSCSTTCIVLFSARAVKPPGAVKFMIASRMRSPAFFPSSSPIPMPSAA